MKFNQARHLLMIFAILAVAVSVISSLVYFATTNFIREDYFKTIKIRAEIVAKLSLENLQDYEKNSLTKVRDGLSEKLENETDFVIPAYANLNYKTIEDSLGLPRNFINTATLQGSHSDHRSDKFFYGMTYAHRDSTFVVVTKAEHHVADSIAAYLKKVSLLAILTIIAFSIFTFIYLKKNIFRPIASITQKVKEIGSENLHLRLKIPKSSVEITELTTTFNDMINRLETSFETQNNFVSNASHEFRTPLTVIMGESEVCLSKDRSIAEYKETIQVIMEEAEKLERKTQALLMLAQTGFDGKAQKFEIVRVDEMMWEVKSTIDKLHSENQVVIDMELLPENPRKLKVFGNAQLLHLAFTNIVLNACKYSNYDIVTVSIALAEEHIVVVIKDRGIGIPDNELKYIYDPFFRASNTGNFEGYGIGLPLTRNIIRMHKGQIDVMSVLQQGVTVQIKLPCAFQ